MQKEVKEKQPPVDVEAIRDISERVYKARLGPADTAQILADPKRGADYLRRCAGSYDTLTRAYLEALDIEIPRLFTTDA